MLFRSIPELNGYFLHDIYSTLSYKTKCNNKITCKDLSVLCKSAYNNTCKVLLPTAFLNMCAPGQQDVHEFFLRKLFLQIQNETDSIEKLPFDSNWESDKIWEWYQRSHANIIDRLFGGQYKGSVKCNSCGFNSDTYDPFLEISLPVLGNCLSDCFDIQFGREKLAKDIGYRCCRCAKVTEAIKVMKINRLPIYLIIHLKRLINGHEKIRKFIKYPLRLDMKDYCANLIGDSVYSLISVCVHAGSAAGGHFYTVGKRGEIV